MTALLRRLVPVLTVLAVVLTPALARADSVAIIRDCQDGRIDGTYSQSQLAKALKEIPTDVDEYTDCRSIIQRAALGDTGGSGNGSDGSGTGGGAGGNDSGTPSVPLPSSNGMTAEQLVAAASPEERVKLATAIQQAGAAPIQLGGEAVSPDASAFSPSGEANTIPTSVALVLLALLGGSAAAVTQAGLKRRRRDPGTPGPGLPA